MSLDPIKYFVHGTYISNLENILSTGELSISTPNDIKITYRKTKFGRNPHSNAKDYPGVYLRLITSDMAGEPVHSILSNYNFDVVFVMCPDLVLRGDFHFNGHEMYGQFRPESTLFTLEQIYSYIEKENRRHEEYNRRYPGLIRSRMHPWNEIVFHHPISLNYVQAIWVKNMEIKIEVEQMLYHFGWSKIPVYVQELHPNIEIPNCNNPKTYPPNHCFYTYDDKMVRWDPANIEWYYHIMRSCGFKDFEYLTKKEMVELLTVPIFKGSNVFEFQQFLIQNGVVKEFVEQMDYELLIEFMQNMTVVDLRELVAYIESLD